MTATDLHEATPALLEPAPDLPGWSGKPLSDRALTALTWGFVALGMIVRVVRYAANPPLWGDEAFLAASFLDRGYLQLVGPLEFYQVAPLLFLWIERTVVLALGFSEWSLRLFPLGSSLASLLMFERLSRAVLRGVPRLLAVAILAVSFAPLRHAVEAKPYASDLLAAVLLLLLAVRWWRSPEAVGRLWLLAAVTPLVLGLSYPAIFVAGGIGLGLFGVVRRCGCRRLWTAYAVYNLGVAAAFGVWFLVLARAQVAVGEAGLRRYWDEGFPPIETPWRLLPWFLEVHASHMLGYPAGGANGASTGTAVLVAIGILVLWRRSRRGLLKFLLAPFGLGLLAALLERYPYGGSARTMQYVAPAVCLLAGLGLARLLGWARRPARALGVSLIVLGAVGLVELVAEVRRPYKSIEDAQARQFARWFWPMLERQGVTACSETDLGVEIPSLPWHRPRRAIYLCNQRIYSPRHARGGGVPWESISAERPLRCVWFDVAPVHPALRRWERLLERRYELRRIVQYTPLPGRPGGGAFEDRYLVYEWVPRSAPSRVADDRLTEARPGSETVR